MHEWDSLDAFLEDARGRLDRVHPEDLADAVADGAVVVDVRDSAIRAAEGEMPGALVFDLTVLEWRLAPSSDHRAVEVGEDDRVILVCNEGYSSSLAAVRLRSLGLGRATDLAGGFRAWKAWIEATPPSD